MADELYYVDLGGPTLTEVRAPFGTPPQELKALARLKGKPLVPSPEGFRKPLPGVQRGDKPIAPGEGGILSSIARVANAAGRGFMEPRRNDPFGLNPENRSPFTILNAPYDIARGGLEIAESLYGGLKQATGQGIYETGVTKDEPQRIAAQLFQPVEVVSAMLPPNPISAMRGTALRTAARTPAQRLVETAERQRVRLLPSDVGGDMIRGATGIMGSSIFGGPIRRASVEGAEQLRDAAGRAGSRLGDVVSDVAAGTDVIQGGRTYVERTRGIGGRLYDRAAALAPNLRARPTNAIQIIDDELAAAARSGDTTSPLVIELQRYRDRLADPAGLPIDGITRVIREAKAAGRQEEALRGTNLNRVMNRVAGAAEDETLDLLRRTGHSQAARAYRNANDYWRTRVETIDNVLEPIIGSGRSGEDVLNSIEAMARGKRGGVARLGDFLNVIPRGAQGDVRATIIDRLGRATSGAQGAAGDVFSPATFLKRYGDMSPEGRRALFGSSPRVQRDLQDIADLAESQKETAKFGNPSGSGRFVEATGLAGTAATAATTLSPTLAFGVAAYAALGAGSARLLASPRFVRLLAGVKNANTPAAQRAFMAGLKELAVREPALAGPLKEMSENLQAPQAEGPTPIARNLSAYEGMSDAELEAMAGPEDPYEGMTDEQLEAMANGESNPAMNASSALSAPAGSGYDPNLSPTDPRQGEPVMTVGKR